ncbi:MAG: hypothetical protein AB7H43_09540 [Acidimicrobiia bacterium]
MTEPMEPGESQAVDVLPRRTKPSRGIRPLVAAFAAVVLVAGTAVAIGSLASDGDSSPEAPVRALFEAAADGDVFGMLEQVAPGEREALREPFADLVTELTRLEVLGEVDLDDLGAYRLEFDDLQLDAEIRSDDLAFVRITGGRAEYSFDPADLPLGPFLASLFGPVESSGPTTGSSELRSDDPGGQDDGVVTVKRDGTWYVSLGYTLAEQARVEAGVSIDDLGDGVEADGAGSAEDAVREIVEATGDLDLRRVLELLPPGEMGALQAYAGLFLEDAEASRPSGYSLTIDELDLESDVDGDVATVKVVSLAATVVTDEGTVRIEDDCVTIEAAGEAPVRTCGNDPTALLGELGLAVPGFRPPPTTAGGGPTPDVGIRAVRVDGRWYVSPVRTVLDAVVASVRTLEPADLEELVSSVQGLLTMGMGGFAMPGASATTGGAGY